MEDRQQEWEGTATNLLNDLEPITSELKINTNSKLWPKSANSLSRKLNEVKTNLREIGIIINYDKDPKTRVKIIKICKVSFESFGSFEDKNHEGIASDNPNDINKSPNDISLEDKISFDKTPEIHAQISNPNETDDKSFAYYRRWLILTFEKVFDEAKKDTKLIQKLTTPEELSGLLNLALIALKQLHKDEGFKDVSVEKVRKEYDKNANTVKAFLESNCIVNLDAPEFYALTTNVYNEYVLFCKYKNENSLEMNMFGKKLAELGIEKDRRRVHRGGELKNYYLGIKLRSDYRDKQQNQSTF